MDVSRIMLSVFTIAQKPNELASVVDDYGTENWKDQTIKLK